MASLPPLDIKANGLTPNRRYGAVLEAPLSKWGWACSLRLFLQAMFL
jgi:hypothetical protein